MKKVYMDHNSTTPLLDEVRAAMMPFLGEEYGNASSIHWAGRRARKALEDAREDIASMLWAEPEEIIFTTSGTEANNLAILGSCLAMPADRRHIITTRVEHSSVLNCFKFLESRGFEVSYAGVDNNGMVNADEVIENIKGNTCLVSVMHVNNETGNIFPVEKIGRITRERGVAFHCDAVQSFGKIEVIPSKINADLLTISGHKIYGPKGTGCLYIRRGMKISPLYYGGNQERGLRPGTENIAGIVGFVKACTIAVNEREKVMEHARRVEERLLKGILDNIPAAHLNGHPEQRIPGVMNISFDGVEGEAVIQNLDLAGIAVSTGSACSSGSLEPSHVLLAMGLDEDRAISGVRFSLGRGNTEEDVETVLNVLKNVIPELRAISPSFRINRRA